MNIPSPIRIAVFAAALGAGWVLAQTAPDLPEAPTTTMPPPVMSDIGPAPAEDRSSAGAVILEKSLVRAQREDAFRKSAQRTGVRSVGSGVLRATMKAKTEADLTEARQAEVLELRQRGAGSLTE